MFGRCLVCWKTVFCFIHCGFKTRNVEKENVTSLLELFIKFDQYDTWNYKKTKVKPVFEKGVILNVNLVKCDHFCIEILKTKRLSKAS